MTKLERLKIYENFFHNISIACTCMQPDRLRDAVGLIDSWSYAHRCGNGELSYKEQLKCVDQVINKMRDF